MPNLFPKVKKYGDQLEARINVIESIQEEFGHDIREIKEQLARLTKLVEDALKLGLYNLESFHPLCLNYPFIFFDIQILVHTFQVRTMFQMKPIALTCVPRCMLR